MGEAACSPSCAGRLCGRQPCATVLVVQEVHHHRHQRLRRHLPPKKQRLLPTLTWQMSVTPATRPENQGPAVDDHRSRHRQERRPSTETIPEGDRPPPQATPGSTFTIEPIRFLRRTMTSCCVSSRTFRVLRVSYRKRSIGNASDTWLHFRVDMFASAMGTFEFRIGRLQCLLLLISSLEILIRFL